MSALYAFGFNSCRQVVRCLHNDRIYEPTVLMYDDCNWLSGDFFDDYLGLSSEHSKSIIDVRISWNCIAALNAHNELLVWCDPRKGVLFKVPFLFTSVCFGTTNIYYNCNGNLLWMSTDSMYNCHDVELKEKRYDESRQVEEVVECQEHFIDIQCCGDGSLYFLSDSLVLYRSERPAGLCEKSGKVTVVKVQYHDLMYNCFTPKIIQVTCGKNHTLCLSDVCVVFSFGKGNQGQLGIGKWDFVMKPRIIDELIGTKIRKICAGGWHNLAISEDGDIFSWGWNRFGQVGLPFKDEDELDSSSDDDNDDDDYDDKNSSSSKKHTHVIDVIYESTSSRPEIVVKKVKSNSDSEPSSPCQPKQPTPELSPSSSARASYTQIQSIPHLLEIPEHLPTAEEPSRIVVGKMTDVACGARHSLCLSANGRVYSWGWNKFGQLGYYDEDDVESNWEPTEITNFRSFKDKRLFAGAWNSVVLIEDGYNYNN